MKKIGLMSVLLLTSACVTQNSSRMNDFPSEGLTTETHGLLLENKIDQRVALRIEKVSPNAKFTRLVPILPGENMRNAYQPATVAAPDEYIIGINGNLNWKSQDDLLNAVTDVYKNKSMITLHVVNSKTWKLQHVVAGDNHILNDLALSSATLTLNVAAVKEVIPKSWAERSGLRVGDEIIGTVQFRSATIRRSNIPFLTYNRNETSSREAPGGDTPAVMTFFDAMFQNIKPYKPTNGNSDGVMGDVGLLRLAVARGSALVHKDLSHSRYVGLGVLFSCTPYCGSAKPIIKAMRENSSGARAGLKLEDLVLSVNGKQVYNSWDTTKRIRKLNFGDTITCRVMRDNQLMDITAKIDWVIED